MKHMDYPESPENCIQITSPTDRREQGFSLLIGAALLFGLAAGGLAIGYISTAVQWAVTAVLGLGGSAFAVSGISQFLGGGR